MLRVRFAPQLFALPADTAALLLFGRGHAHEGKGIAIAGQVAVQPADQFGGIGLVRVDALAQRVELHGPDDVTFHAPGGELTRKDETARNGFIDGDHFGRLRELLFDETFQVGARINALGWLRARTVELADDPQIRGVLIDAQEDAITERFCPLRVGLGCGEVNRI